MAILPQKRIGTHFQEVYQTFSHFWNIIETNHIGRLLSLENSHGSQICYNQLYYWGLYYKKDIFTQFFFTQLPSNLSIKHLALQNNKSCQYWKLILNFYLYIEVLFDISRILDFLHKNTLLSQNLAFQSLEICPAGTMTYRNINPISIDILILNFWLEGSFVQYFQKFVILKQKTHFLPNFEAF